MEVSGKKSDVVVFLVVEVLRLILVGATVEAIVLVISCQSADGVADRS